MATNFLALAAGLVFFWGAVGTGGLAGGGVMAGWISRGGAVWFAAAEAVKPGCLVAAGFSWIKMV